jgi:hypothetical protein
MVLMRFENLSRSLSINGLNKSKNGKGVDDVLFFERMEAVMRCGRCNGIMVFEKFYSQEYSFFGWRCLYCGEIIDKVILENRLAQSR